VRARAAPSVAAAFARPRNDIYAGLIRVDGTVSDQARYNRIVLKISGQAMCAPGGSGIDAPAVSIVIDELRPIIAMGVQVGLVVGGGNFIRGRDFIDDGKIRRVTADYMGMLATVMNAVALRDNMIAEGLEACVLSAFATPRICESFTVAEANRRLQAGQVVILAGGTGSPFFTTDMCAAVRANEIGAEALFKATKVDGVFDDDPEINADARKYDRLTYQKVLADKLAVMDLTAVSMCMEHGLPIVVFQLTKSGNLLKAVKGEPVGTLVTA